jgi:acetylglutamate kinase
MTEPRVSAEAFLAAVDRVRARRDRPAVVKLGGSAMEDPAATDSCLRCVVALNALGVPLVLVHGGGKPIDRAMAEAGLTPKKVAGRRYTDAATLDIVVRVLHEINARLVEQIIRLGGRAESYTPAGLDGERLVLTGADDRSVDLGRVGGALSSSGRAYSESFARGAVAVVPSLAWERAARSSAAFRATDFTALLNVNADTAASALVGVVQAERAIFLTDTPGVLRARADPGSLIPQLPEGEARELIASGVIDGGMVPKVEACFDALAAGASSALILDGRQPFSLLDVFLRNTFKGTAITR